MNDFYVEFSRKINSINFNEDPFRDCSYKIDSNFVAINTCKSEYDNGFFELDNRFFICSNSRIDNRNELKKILKINNDIDDSALILKMYIRFHEGFVNYLNGAFCFFIIDKMKNSILIARDHMGMRPLYISESHDGFKLSTNISSFKNHDFDLSINKEALKNQILYTLPKNNETLYKNINFISPGCILLVNNGRYIVNNFTNYEEIKINYYKKEAEYIDEFKELFEKVIYEQMSSCKKNIGISLSGGLDSSSISCVANNINNNKNLNKNIFYNSAIFKGLEDQDFLKADERFYMDKVYGQLDGNINFIELANTGPITNLEKFSNIFSQPIKSPNCYINYLMFKDLNKKGVNCNFEGYDGDDVISHGYEHLFYLGKKFKLIELYKQEKKLRYRRNLEFSFINSIKNYVLRPLVPKPLKSIIRRIKGKNPAYIRWSKIIKSEYLDNTHIENDLISIYGSNPFEYVDPELSHLYTIKNRNKTYGAEFLYELGNKFNVEPMFPFFDRRLIEFALSVPSCMKLNNGYDRFYFRQAMKDLAPIEITHRTTKADISPFVINEMMNLDKNKFNEIIFDNDSLSQMINKEVVNDEFCKMKDKNDHTFLPNLYRLISIGDWIKQKKIET